MWNCFQECVVFLCVDQLHNDPAFCGGKIKEFLFIHLYCRQRAVQLGKHVNDCIKILCHLVKFVVFFQIDRGRCIRSRIVEDNPVPNLPIGFQFLCEAETGIADVPAL